jgi:N utilization substance protein B
VTTSRRQARRAALFALYKADLTGRPVELEPDADEYAVRLAEDVAAESATLDRRITETSQGWPADRLGVVERNVLRIAIHEIEGRLVPTEVAIDEAVTLAKRYATDEAGKLVNGILGRVAREAA